MQPHRFDEEDLVLIPPHFRLDVPDAVPTWFLQFYDPHHTPDGRKIHPPPPSPDAIRAQKALYQARVAARGRTSPGRPQDPQPEAHTEGLTQPQAETEVMPARGTSEPTSDASRTQRLTQPNKSHRRQGNGNSPKLREKGKGKGSLHQYDVSDDEDGGEDGGETPTDELSIDRTPQTLDVAPTRKRLRQNGEVSTSRGSAEVTHADPMDVDVVPLEQSRSELTDGIGMPAVRHYRARGQLLDLQPSSIDSPYAPPAAHASILDNDDRDPDYQVPLLSGMSLQLYPDALTLRYVQAPGAP